VIELNFENIHSRQDRICQVKFSKSSLTESLYSQFVGENDFWEFEPPIQRWQMGPNPRALGARRARPFRRCLWCIAKAAPPARLRIVKYVCIYMYVCASLCLDVCMYVLYIMYMYIMYMYNIWICIIYE